MIPLWVMQSLSNLDVSILVAELQLLVSSRLDNIYGVNDTNEGLLLQFHISGKGKFFVRVIPSALWLCDQKPTVEERPSGFVGKLRKHLEGKKVHSVSQVNGRCVLFVVGKEEFSLVIELFGGGNVVLCENKNGIAVTLCCKRIVQFVARTVEVGEKYVLKKDVPRGDMSKEEISDKLNMDEPVSKVLATLIGKNYALEGCLLAGIDPQMKAKDAPKEKITKSFLKITNAPVAARVVTTQSGLLAVPFALSIHDELPFKEYSSFSLALDAVNSTVQKPKENKKISKLLVAIEQQEKIAKEYEEQSIEDQRRGEMIYENYGTVKEVLEIAKEFRKQPEKLKIALAKKNAVYDPASGMITVELS